jgi:hypothetical protein
VKTPASKTPAAPEAAAPLPAEPSFFPAPAEFTRDGFFLVGTVLARVRRQFPGTEGKPTRYNITLGIQTADGLQRPERWCDTPSPPDVPARGARVVLPVVLSFYQGKGGTGCRLKWGASSSGEEF